MSTTTRAKPEKLRRPKPSRDARIAQAAFRKALGRRDASAFDFQADTPMIGFSAPGIVSDKAMREAKRKAMEAVRADQLLRRRDGERRVADSTGADMAAQSASQPDTDLYSGRVAVRIRRIRLANGIGVAVFADKLITLRQKAESNKAPKMLAAALLELPGEKEKLIPRIHHYESHRADLPPDLYPVWAKALGVTLAEMLPAE